MVLLQCLVRLCYPFLYSMAKSDVERKDREARWAKQEADRKGSRKMLME